MGRVDSATAGVQERDKWRQRLEALERSLAELLEKRRHLEERLERVHEELAKLRRTAREFVEIRAGSHTAREVTIGPRGPLLR
jgi:predicted  nucleic acid-binding Zn-ribbon protein